MSFCFPIAANVLLWMQTLDRTEYDRRWDEERRAEAEAITWFHDLYFDPVAEAKAGTKRRYRWLPEDTIDPYEVLFERFGRRISRQSISSMAEELVVQSSNWRTRPDEFPDGIPISQSPRSQINNVMINAERRDLIEEIVALRAIISGIQSPQPLFGHNMPPEGIADEVVFKDELATLSKTIDEIELQARSKKPDVAVIQESQKELATFAQKVLTWSGTRGTKFVDAVIDSSGKALGAAIILQITGILPQIFSVITKASSFVDALTN